MAKISLAGKYVNPADNAADNASPYLQSVDVHPVGRHYPTLAALPQVNCQPDGHVDGQGRSERPHISAYQVQLLLLKVWYDGERAEFGQKLHLFRRDHLCSAMVDSVKIKMVVTMAVESRSKP